VDQIWRLEDKQRNPRRRPRAVSIAFKRQIAQEFLSGEVSLHGLAKRTDICRNLIRVWVEKYERGELDDEVELAGPGEGGGKAMTTGTAEFTGFRPAAFAFLTELRDNNDPAWFKPRKAVYEAEVLQPFRELVLAVAATLGQGGLPLVGDPKQAIFRIYRDIRFSRDKRPYKTHAGAVLTRSGSWLEQRLPLYGAIGTVARGWAPKARKKMRQPRADRDRVPSAEGTSITFARCRPNDYDPHLYQTLFEETKE
jgi:hypothetical protein